jgi:hypothetical protein
MNKRNLISATLILLMSLVSMVFGYWVGEKGKSEIAMSYIDLVDSMQRQEFSDAKIDLDTLRALKEGKDEIAHKILELKVRSGLTYIELDEIFGEEVRAPIKPSKKLLDQAAEYQAKYCEDKCLGI